MASLIEVWDARLGTSEIAGKKHNPVILQWCKDAGHPEILDDETAWCSTSMCSACKEAGLPFPPVNVNPMARSWLTMGKGVAMAEAAPGDIVVWPRGNPAGPSGHVNMIREIKRTGTKTLVRCIGGNQSDPSGGAVTLTPWADLGGSCQRGIRRMVPSTVAALRQAGSTEIKKADNIEKIGTTVTIGSMITASVKELFGPVAVPQFANVGEGLSFWQMTMGAFNGFAYEIVTHPLFFGACLIGIAAWFVARKIKQARVAKHAMGVPLSAEVAKLEGA